MAILKVIGGRDKYSGNYIDTTTKSNTWSRGLSPMILKSINLYDDYKSENMENAWQYSKVYPEYADKDGNPTEEYFKWAKEGWSKKWADRYPVGKGRKPLYSYWAGNKLDYIEGRKKIYIPLYAKAVIGTNAFKQLKTMYDNGQDIVLWDYDGYDYEKHGMTLDEVLNCESRKMGHAFVLVMLLIGKVEVLDNKVIIHEDTVNQVKKEPIYEQQTFF